MGAIFFVIFSEKMLIFSEKTTSEIFQKLFRKSVFKKNRSARDLSIAHGFAAPEGPEPIC